MQSGKFGGNMPNWVRRDLWMFDQQRRLDYWRDRLPEEVAYRQVAWERRQLAIRMRQQTSLSYAKMGEALGVTTERVRQIVFVGQRERNTVAPVEHYLREMPDKDVEKCWRICPSWRVGIKGLGRAMVNSLEAFK